MSKKCIREDFHVTVVPTWLEHETEQQRMDTCDRIALKISRHMDDISSVYADWSIRYVCSHCGSEWEVDAAGVPLCCQRAMNEFRAQEDTDVE